MRKLVVNPSTRKLILQPSGRKAFFAAGVRQGPAGTAIAGHTYEHTFTLGETQVTLPGTPQTGTLRLRFRGSTYEGAVTQTNPTNLLSPLRDAFTTGDVLVFDYLTAT